MEVKKCLVEGFQMQMEAPAQPFILASMFVGKNLNQNSALESAW